MKSLHVVILGSDPDERAAQTRASVAWAGRVTSVAAASAVPVDAPWTLVLLPGETLSADAPQMLEARLASVDGPTAALPILSVLGGAACRSALLSPPSETRLLRPPASWPASQGAPLVGVTIHRDLGASPELAVCRLPVETRAERAIALALEAWRSRGVEVPVIERRALALYAWRLLVAADDADGEALSELLSLPVQTVQRDPNSLLDQLTRQTKSAHESLEAAKKALGEAVSDNEKMRSRLAEIDRNWIGRLLHKRARERQPD